MPHNLSYQGFSLRPTPVQGPKQDMMMVIMLCQCQCHCATAAVGHSLTVSDIISCPSFEAADYTMDSMAMSICNLELITFNLQ